MTEREDCEELMDRLCVLRDEARAGLMNTTQGLRPYAIYYAWEEGVIMALYRPTAAGEIEWETKLEPWECAAAGGNHVFYV